MTLVFGAGAWSGQEGHVRGDGVSIRRIPDAGV